jgi:hypothetical protein
MTEDKKTKGRMNECKMTEGKMVEGQRWAPALFSRFRAREREAKKRARKREEKKARKKRKRRAQKKKARIRAFSSHPNWKTDFRAQSRWAGRKQGS